MVRVKSRYLLCEVNVSDRSDLLLLDDRAVAAAVKAVVARTHGDYGAALCSIRFSVKYLNAHTGIVFLRFPKRCYKLLWSALPFITNIESRGKKIPCFLNCLHVGGTIRTCQKFLIRYNTQQLHRMLPKCKNEVIWIYADLEESKYLLKDADFHQTVLEERQQIRRAILNCSLTGRSKEAFVDESESEDDDEEE